VRAAAGCALLLFCIVSVGFPGSCNFTCLKSVVGPGNWDQNLARVGERYIISKTSFAKVSPVFDRILYTAREHKDATVSPVLCVFCHGLARRYIICGFFLREQREALFVNSTAINPVAGLFLEIISSICVPSSDRCDIAANIKADNWAFTDIFDNERYIYAEIPILYDEAVNTIEYYLNPRPLVCLHSVKLALHDGQLASEDYILRSRNPNHHQSQPSYDPSGVGSSSGRLIAAAFLCLLGAAILKKALHVLGRPNEPIGIQVLVWVALMTSAIFVIQGTVLILLRKWLPNTFQIYAVPR
jgi:hypothetical protein